MTMLYLQLRAAERFGMDPRIVLFQWEPGLRSLAVHYEILREHEERRAARDAAMIAAGGAPA